MASPDQTPFEDRIKETLIDLYGPDHPEYRTIQGEDSITAITTDTDSGFATPIPGDTNALSLELRASSNPHLQELYERILQNDPSARRELVGLIKEIGLVGELSQVVSKLAGAANRSTAAGLFLAELSYGLDKHETRNQVAGVVQQACRNHGNYRAQDIWENPKEDEDENSLYKIPKLTMNGR